MPRPTAWLSKVNPKLPSLPICTPLSPLHSHHMLFLRAFGAFTASEASSFPPGDFPKREKKSRADFPQTRRPLFVLISCQHTRGDLHAGAPHPPGAKQAARSSPCLAVGERQRSWIKGVYKCRRLIKANQLAFLCT